MKKGLFILLMFSPIFCNAQKIDKNIKDDFTNKQMVTTTWESIYPSLTSVIQFRFRYEGDKQYFDLIYRNGLNDCVNEGNAIEFKANDGVHQLGSEQYTVIISSQNPIEILRYCGDMNFFSTSHIEKIRVHFNSGYDDIVIKPKKAAIIEKAYKIFTEAINKK